jgi:hypothetical protein
MPDEGYGVRLMETWNQIEYQVTAKVTNQGGRNSRYFLIDESNLENHLESHQNRPSRVG